MWHFLTPEFRFGSALEKSGAKWLNSVQAVGEACPCLIMYTETYSTLHLFRLLSRIKAKIKPFAWNFAVHPYFRFFYQSALCVIVLLSLLVFSCFVWLSFCFACAAVFASVSIFSLLHSRSQSLEGNDQLGEVHEEEEVGKGGEGERKATKVGRSQRGCKGSGAKIDTDIEHQQDMVEKEEDLYQRSISETDLR